MAGGRRDGTTNRDVGTGDLVGASTRSRRALGDVSNKESKDAPEEATKKPEGRTLRRSRRLSNEVAARPESNLVDEPAESRSQSLPSNSETNNATNPLREPQPRGRPGRKRASKTEPEDDSKPAAIDSKPKAKRSRVTLKEETAPRKRNRRSQSNSRSEMAADEPSVPLTTGENPCPDLLPITDYGLERKPFSARQYTQGISSYDAKDKDNVLQVPKYATDIFQRLYDAEGSTRPRPYMDRQPQLNSMMRSILVDWLVEVHMKFLLLPETLYLCINIIDRYLCMKEVTRNRLQLLGVTALLIACKYEEIYPPEVKDCVYITDRAYTRQDVLDMEAEVVKTLLFTLTVPTGHPFLQRFLHITESSGLVRNLANFYMERMLLEHGSLNFKPSLLAAAAVCLASSNPDRLDCEGFSEEEQQKIPYPVLEYTGFTEAEIKGAAVFIEEKFNDVNATQRSRNLVSVKRKYESTRYNQVSSNFMLPKACHLDTL